MAISSSMKSTLTLTPRLGLLFLNSLMSFHFSMSSMVYKKAVQFAKDNNIKIYAANRMQVSSFITPFTRYGWNMKFVDEIKSYGVNVALGNFGNHMHIDTELDGPFTIIIESEGRGTE